MRVCFISFEFPPNILGGAGTYAETLVKGLRQKGVDVFVISRGNQHDQHQKTFRVPSSNSLYWRRLFFIEPAMSLFHKLNSRFRFDLVHFNEPHVILEKLKLPTVCTLHSSQINEIKLKFAYKGTLETKTDMKDLVLKSSVGSIFDILTAHAVDKIICPSPDMAALINSYCFVNRNRIAVVPNGIELELNSRKNCEDPDPYLRQHGLERDNYALFIGRLTVLKGVQYAIEAFRGISKDHPNTKLAIVGQGDYGSHLKNLARGMRNVVFLGQVNSSKVKKILYENSLLVIVPSLYEALPMVVLEAMAYSKAIIASNVGGIPMLVKHGRNGFLAKPEDYKSIENFTRTLLEGANLRKNMGSFGRTLVEKQFTVDKMVSRTLRVYESLVQSHRTCARGYASP